MVFVCRDYVCCDDCAVEIYC